MYVCMYVCMYVVQTSRKWLKMQVRPFCLMRTPKWLRPKIAATEKCYVCDCET